MKKGRADKDVLSIAGLAPHASMEMILGVWGGIPVMGNVDVAQDEIAFYEHFGKYVLGVIPVKGLFLFPCAAGKPGIWSGNSSGLPDRGTGESIGSRVGNNQMWWVYLFDDGRTAD